jgi:nitrous oxidase accessory protein NosD
MSPARRFPALNAIFFLVLGVMLLHQAEHFAQVVQKNALDAACPNDCRGILGFVFDIEWVHFAYNTSILVSLTALYVAYRMWRPEWRRTNMGAWVAMTAAVGVIQGYHVVEHTWKLVQWFQNGRRSPTPGLLGQPLAPAEGRNFSLVELHFLLNTVVLVGVVVAWFGFGFHRFLWTRAARPLWVGVTVVLALAVVGGAAAWTERPPTMRLAARVYHGPLVIDRAMRLIGRSGTVVRGGIHVRANDVVVRDLAVVGGVNGIEVDGAKAVVLQNVSVSGAQIDGIHVRRASVLIRRCHVESGRNPWAQAIDISFSFDLPPSMIKKCTIRGGREGIVTHSAKVMVRGNRIRATSLRGIGMTEMSMGEIRGNHVEDAVGVGIFCGDYSHCRIVKNRVVGTRPDHASADLTRRGFPVQAHYYAHATVERNTLVGNPRGVSAFAGARLIRPGRGG